MYAKTRRNAAGRRGAFVNIGAAIVPLLFVFVIGYGLYRRVDVYEAFVAGAAEGLPVLIKILPYLAAMLIAIAVLRDSGLIDRLVTLLSPVCSAIGMDAPLLPLILLRPFSGSAAMASLTEIFNQYGADSSIGYTASVLMGSSETIFYEVALYFGAIGIKRTRFAVPVSLISMAVGVVTAIAVSKAFF